MFSPGRNSFKSTYSIRHTFSKLKLNGRSIKDSPSSPLDVSDILWPGSSFDNASEIRNSGLSSDSSNTFKSLDSQNYKVARAKVSLTNLFCGICEDQYLIGLNSEEVVGFACGHDCHVSCYSAVASSDNGEIFCKQCSNVTQRQNSGFSMDVGSDFNVEDCINELCMEEENETHVMPTSVPIATSTPIATRFNFPQSLTEFDEQFLEETVRPRVRLIPETSKLTIDAMKKTYTLPCVVHVQMSDFSVSDSQCQDELILEQEKRLAISSHLFDTLVTLKHGDLLAANDQTIIMFDLFQVETAINEWRMYTCYLFDTDLILSDGESIVAKIKYRLDIASITEIDPQTMTLNFSSINVPTLTVRASVKTTICKWKNYFTHIILQLGNSPVPLIQMSADFRSLILDPRLIPEEVKHMGELLDSNMELPIPLLKKLISRPVPLALNLVIAVSLINNLARTNEQYRELIKEKILEIIGCLNPKYDKLGVVYLYANDVVSSSFITGITSQESFERHFSYLSVSSSNSLITNLDQMVYFLESTEKLLGFWNLEDSKTINKVVIINDRYSGTSVSLSYQDKLQKAKFPKLLNSIMIKHKFTLLLYLVNDGFDDYYLDLIQSVINTNFQVYGSTFSKISSLEALDVADWIVNQARTITVARVKVKLSSLKLENITLSHNNLTNNLLKNPNVEYFELEIADHTTLEIFVNEIYPGYCKAIPINIKLNVTRKLRQVLEHTYSHSPDHGLRLPMVQCQTAIVNDKVLTEDTYVRVKFPSNQQTPLTEDFPSSSRTSIATEYELPMFCKPLACSRDPAFAKNQVELVVVRELLRAIGLKNKTSLDILLECISHIHAIAKGCQIIVSSAKDFIMDGDMTSNNVAYVEYLSFILQSIACLFVHCAEDAIKSSFELIFSLCFS